MGLAFLMQNIYDQIKNEIKHWEKGGFGFSNAKNIRIKKKEINHCFSYNKRCICCVKLSLTGESADKPKSAEEPKRAKE